MHPKIYLKKVLIDNEQGIKNLNSIFSFNPEYIQSVFSFFTKFKNKTILKCLSESEDIVPC